MIEVIRCDMLKWHCRILILSCHKRGASLDTMPISPSDAPFLFELYASTRADEMRAWGWDETTQRAFLQMQWTAQQQSYAAQYPDADHRILIHHHLRAGRILISRSGQAVILVDLTLLPEHRGKGIGTALLQDLQREAAELGKPLRLSVLKTNPARRLYARLGFTQTGGNELYDFLEWQHQNSTRGDQNE